MNTFVIFFFLFYLSSRVSFHQSHTVLIQSHIKIVLPANICVVVNEGKCFFWEVVEGEGRGACDGTGNRSDSKHKQHSEFILSILTWLFVEAPGELCTHTDCRGWDYLVDVENGGTTTASSPTVKTVTGDGEEEEERGWLRKQVHPTIELLLM